MLLLYYIHSILFYLGLPTFQSNENDFNKKLQSFDYEYLPQEVCVAQCLERTKKNITPTDLHFHWSSRYAEYNQYLKNCLNNCTSINVTQHTDGNSNHTTPKQIHDNYSLNLICRDDSSLNFNIELHDVIENFKIDVNKSVEIKSTTLGITVDAKSNENTNGINVKAFGTVFVIKVHMASDVDKYFVYLSDENFFTIEKLMANTTYNISVLAVHSNNKYSVIAQQQQFKTLRRSYTPGNVTEIKISHFTEDNANKMYLKAIVTWKPATDMTCYYDIICFSPESESYDLQPIEIRNPRQLYKYQLENLTFSSVYKVGIRASNTKGMRESELFWKTFAVPSCLEWHNYNFSICAPQAPQNLQVEQQFIDEHIYSLNISWMLPTHLPENYTLRIQDLSVHGETTTYQLDKDICNFFIPKISLYGAFYEVSLTAYTRGGHTTTSFTDLTKTVVHVMEKNPFVKLIAVILAPIFCVAILSLTLFIIYHRRAKLKRYQERCKYFEKLESKAPIDPGNSFDFIPHLKENHNDFPYQVEVQESIIYNDEMEIDRNDLVLYQILGEGAFGLVKLGLYTDSKLGTTQQVAVKMLKDHPSADDIYAFRREIEVMKSVPKHPNIVGIIGHCTRFSNEMMLVTEYCSFGNLLNFLRDEWHFLHEKQSLNDLTEDDIVYKNRINDLKTDNEDDIELFTLKYNNNINKSEDDNNEKILKTMVFEHIEESNPTTMKKPTHRPLTTKIADTKISLSNSSSNCEMDVSIRNIEATDAETQNEKFDCVLSEQHLGGTKTVQIKTDDCNMMQQKDDNNKLFNGVIENKLYFGLFTSDNKYLSCKCQNSSPAVKKAKPTNKAKSKVPKLDKTDQSENIASIKSTIHSDRVPLSNGDLINIASQIAVGMEFLAKNKVVHRDLAARNVLVAPDRTVKIADFGLSRDVYQENIYKKTGNGKLPIKWLALESMTHQVYTTQSDVWSYGVLLYEIVTLGATPYPSISTNRLLHLLKSGYRMEKPKGCDQEFYDLMYSCWNAEPIKRPTFNEIIQKLDEMMNCLDKPKEHRTVYLEVDNNLGTTQKNVQNFTNDESYLKPL